MQISNVTSGYSDPTATGKRAEPLEATAARGLKTDEPGGSSARTSTATAARILASYNVHDISPTEFSAMVQKLYSSRAISDSELQELTAIRHDLDAAGADPDKRIDLQEFYTDKVRKLQRKSDQPQSQQAMAPAIRHLQWIQKFSIIQAHPEAAGLSTLA